MKGGGGSSKCVGVHTRGRGAGTLSMYTKQKIISFLDTSAIFSFAKDPRHLITLVCIQLKLLLVQGCQTYDPHAKSINVAS